jgi:SAM-dependent methyltransferase
MADENLTTRMLDKVRRFAEATPEERIALIRDLPRAMALAAKAVLAPPHEVRQFTAPELVNQALVWSTGQQAELLGAEASLTDWARRWLTAQLEAIRLADGGDGLVDRILLDLSPGRSNPAIAHYADKVRHAWLVGAAAPAEPLERGTFLEADLARPLPLPSESVDLVVSANGLDCLSRDGRLGIMREIERVLKPGGRVLVTLSYVFGLTQRVLDRIAKDKALGHRTDAIRSGLDLAEILNEAGALRLLGEYDPSVVPGFEEFDERKVRKLPGLLLEPLGESEWAAQARASIRRMRRAVLGLVVEKPPVGDTHAARAARTRSLTRIGVTGPGPRFERLLTACPSLEGKKILVVSDDASDFAAQIEHAGATVHSCVPDMATYEAVTKRFPGRRCWIHDLNQPWTLAVGERYDIVVAFDVLQRLDDPQPFMAYVTQLAPEVVIDTLVVDSADQKVARLDEEQARCAPSPGWIEEQCERFDVDVHDLSHALDDAPDGSYAWTAADSGNHTRNGVPLRRLYLCRRRRDALSPLIVHVHMQKTGGQSVNEFLRKYSLRRMLFFFDEEHKPGQWDVFERAVNRQRPEPLVFTSHVMRYTFPPLLGGRLALYFSLFRHPYDVVFSYVKYIRKRYDLQLPSLKRILPENVKEMSVEQLMKWYLRNPVIEHFAGHLLPVFHLTQMDDVERAKQLVGRFLFIGITEEMQRSMAVLKRKLAPYGFVFPDIAWEWRNTTADVELGGYDIRQDKEFLDYAENNLAHEVAFYEWAREQFERDAAHYGI